MAGSELRRRLKAVDPDLKIIPGGTRRHQHRANKEDNANWGRSAGPICSKCGVEYFRGRDGLCYQCWEEEKEIEIRDKTGITSWLPMDILKQITHQSRKNQR